MHILLPHTELIGSRVRVDLLLWLFPFPFFYYMVNHLRRSGKDRPKCRAGQINGAKGFSMSIWEISERKRLPVGICVRVGTGMT
jgi:hypothetical protein